MGNHETLQTALIFLVAIVIDLNHRGRDIEVGDIHGCFSRLEAALALVGFDAGRDCLAAVGDLVIAGRSRPRC